jgi:hypothetical protein
MKRFLADRLGWRSLCFVLSFLVGTGMATAADPTENETSRRPGRSPDPFFRPIEDQSLGEIPKALSPAGEPVEDFFTPESTDSLDDLPPTLDANGNPLGPYRQKESVEAAPSGGGAQESWVRSGGFLEYHGTYSTNIDLSAPEIDFDLRRNHVSNTSEVYETEVSDWVNSVEFGYEKQFAIVPDQMKGALRYHLYGELFADEDRENRQRHTFEFATIQRLCENIEWEVYGGFETENRDDEAQFIRPDYDMWYFGTEVRQDLGGRNFLRLGYEFDNRHYETLFGGIPRTDTPYEDWQEHRFWARYDREMCDWVTLNLGVDFHDRDYDQETSNALGANVDGRYRQYDLWEPRAGFTFYPTKNDRLSAYYLMRDLDSTGQYYDYQENSLNLEYSHAILPDCFPGLVFRSEFEFAKRDYDHQVAFKNNAATRTQTSKNTAREDDRVTVYLALERTVEDWTTGVEFTYVDNDSNDDSSRYQEDRYGVYVRREF